MIRIALMLALAAALSACNPPEAKPVPPQLWSHHKSLDVSPATCAEMARAAFDAAGFTDIVTKDYFTYANHGSNRGAVKCVGLQPAGSFVYFAVAGPDKASVEKLRNQISSKL